MTITSKCILSTCACLFGFLKSCICNLSYQDPLDPDPGKMCPGPIGNVTQYQINFLTGSSNITDSVTTMCRAGRCSYTFVPPSNPPSSYNSVSVAAENVVGVGAARTCTPQPIGELNDIMLHFQK